MNKKHVGFSVVAVAILIAASATYWWSQHRPESAAAPADDVKFALVEAADRSFDGAPALALTFTQPLDTGTHYDTSIQIFEMPPRPGDRIARQDADEEGEDESGHFLQVQPEISTAAEDIRTEGGKAVSGAWVVGDNPRLLFFPHVKPQTRYVVRVDPKLTSGNGAQLDVESSYSILTAAVSPAYYFASRGMVLPARQNGGLPVITVNVPEVDVQFMRVKDDQLPNFLDQVIAAAPKQSEKKTNSQSDPDASEYDEEDNDYDWDNNRIRSLRGAVSNWELDRLHKLAESVYIGRFVTEQKQNKRSVTYLPVENIKELQEPGMYVAIMNQPGRFRYDFQATYFYVSDIGLHARLFDKSAEAFVSSLTDGKGVRGVEVSWLDGEGKTLARAESDDDGRASFAERPKGGQVLVARKGKQVSMIAMKEPALDLSEYEATGDPFKPVRLFAYSGRNLYRPGEHFDVSVLARDADGRAVPATPVQAILKRPDGRNQFTASWQPDKRFAGYYLRRIDLPADAPTGFWTLELRADPGDKVPATVYRFGVEEFLPERMKLELDAPTTIATSASTLRADVRGSYLYGAPAGGNRLLAVAQYERSRNPLQQKYPGFEFGDFAEDAAKKREELPESTLDDQGHASIDVDLAPLAGRHSPFAVRATVSLLESGGRPVVRTIERVVWPANTLVAVRPLFVGDYAKQDSSVEFEVIRVDQAGTQKPGRGLPVRLFRENRDYYWRFDDQRGWHSGFNETDELVETSSVNIPAAGRGKLTVPVRYGRYRVEILDPETNQTLRYRFYAGWSAKEDESQGIRPDRVALRLDKAGYQEGGTARLTIAPPHAGEALITVEGSSLLWMKRTSIPAKGATIDIPIAKTWQRHDLYVSVIVLRPGNEGDQVTPARALGLLHLPLERSNRKLNVVLEAAPKMLPETSLKVKVKAAEAKGRQALVTLSAVDAGILNITRFATPDPYGFFFGKLRYGADQHDIYGRLIEKMPGQKGKLKFGGDDTPRATKSLPKKVKLVDLFSGPVQLDANGEAVITLPVPDFNGTLRLMAVVSLPDRFGSKDAEVIVAAPLVAELATPRFLSFGDTATIALDLNNLSGTAQVLKVAVNARGDTRIHEGNRTLSLKDKQKSTLRFNIDAGTVFGLTDIRVKVEGKGIRIDRSFPLMIQAPAPQQQETRRYSVAPGEVVEIRDAELAGFYRNSMAAHIMISDKAPIDVRSAIQGLLRYPYGCAEQTTSTAYPHVFVDDEMARRFGLKPYTREQRVRMLESAIGRLATMQAPSGGFSLWGNVSEYEYWLSAYVTSFLQDAREQNFGVPDAMHRKAMDFLLRGLQEGASRMPTDAAGRNDSPENNPRFWDDYRYRDNARFGVLAHGAYVLARESRAPLSTLRQMFNARSQAHSGLSLVQLGIALKLMGDDGRGDSAIAEGMGKGRSDNYWWGDYGSNVRDAALSYVLLERHKLKPKGMDNLVAVIAAEMDKQRYYSTQEQMALFLVGRSFSTDAGSKGAEWNANIQTRGKVDAIKSRDAVFRELSAEDVGSGIRLTNQHKARLYVELAISGFPTKPLPERKDPIALSRSFFTADGAPLGERPLKVGETIMVKVDVRSRTSIPNGLVVDRVPAGIEIENLNIVQGEQMGLVNVDNVNVATAMMDSRIRHVEFRDDRFVAAVRLDGSRELNLFYRARVVTPGKFVVPPVYAEDMYRPEIFGVTQRGDTLTVIEAESRR